MWYKNVMPKPIRDYAIIGNMRSAVLVSKYGSIDWAPAPYIDSPSVFARILDEDKGGYWRIAPAADDYTVTQEYVPRTNILITRFTTKTGVFDVVDWLPIESDHPYMTRGERPIFEIFRKIVGLDGLSALRVEFVPRYDYARERTELTLSSHGVLAKSETREGILISNAPFALKDDAAVADIEVAAGQQLYFTFRFNTTTILFDEVFRYEDELRRTKEFWEDWVHRCDGHTCPVAGPWHDMVIRSSLILKILFFEPPGTIAAAATTSLPEVMGGERNWDYRFTWIRDSAFTLRALFRLGYIEEAKDYITWLLGICGSDAGNLQVLYGLRGEKDLHEETLELLSGYAGSRPVRVGNAAYSQQQWDMYGSVLDTVWQLHQLSPGTSMVTPRVWESLRAMVNRVVAVWREPDEGIWEMRDGKRHFTHSKLMCWVALDRALKIAAAYNFPLNGERWESERAAIEKEIHSRAWSEQKKSFTQSFDSETLDAAVLMMPVVGFIDGTDERMRSTIQAVQQELGVGDTLLRRYKADDGLTGEEGAFLLTSFWLVDALALAGEQEKARALYMRLLELANHVGLFAEEIDPKSKAFLGNFPQAFTHIGLINSAFYLRAPHQAGGV